MAVRSENRVIFLSLTGSGPLDVFTGLLVTKPETCASPNHPGGVLRLGVWMLAERSTDKIQTGGRLLAQ